MVDMFETKICNYCKNTECDNKIIEFKDGNLTTYKCENYMKDASKIIPPEPSLFVTAKRDYINYVER